MSIWSAIKHSINSTLGTSDFKPLDKIITDNKSLQASDEHYYLLADVFDSDAKTKNLGVSVKMRETGSIKISVKIAGGTSTIKRYFDVKKNGTNAITLEWTNNTAADTEENATINFAKGDILTFVGRTTSALGFRFKDIWLCGRVVDTSVIEIGE